MGAKVAELDDFFMDEFRKMQNKLDNISDLVVQLRSTHDHYLAKAERNEIMIDRLSAELQHLKTFRDSAQGSINALKIFTGGFLVFILGSLATYVNVINQNRQNIAVLTAGLDNLSKAVNDNANTLKTHIRSTEVEADH